MAKRILLADDSVTIQKVVELTFMDEDYEVIAVSDGDQAIQRLLETAPDVVISDVHMPATNGYEVCRRAKQTFPELPVILLVGTFEPFDETEAQAAGADGHLKKPFDSQDLLHLVEQLVSRAASTPAIQEDVPPEPAAPSVQEAPTEMADTRPTSAREAEEPQSAFAAANSLSDDVLKPATSEVMEPAEDPLDDTGTLRSEDIPAVVEAEFTPAPEPQPAAEEVVATLDFSQPEAVVAAPTEPEPVEPPPAEPQAEAPEAAVAAEPAAVPAAGNGQSSMSSDDVDRIARRVVELAGDRVLREVAWEIIPDLAEVVIKERIRELESQVEGE